MSRSLRRGTRPIKITAPTSCSERRGTRPTQNYRTTVAFPIVAERDPLKITATTSCSTRRGTRPVFTITFILILLAVCGAIKSDRPYPIDLDHTGTFAFLGTSLLCPQDGPPPPPKVANATYTHTHLLFSPEGLIPRGSKM